MMRQRQATVSANILGPKVLQRVEGGVLLALSLLLYEKSGAEWWLFALLLLAPDLSALGYLAGSSIGAASYNLFHNYLLPGALVTLGVLSSSLLPVWLALIWFAHIGTDRLVGYGLKYPGSFNETHLGRIGRDKRPLNISA
jgi:hypothetical protein